MIIDHNSQEHDTMLCFFTSAITIRDISAMFQYFLIIWHASMWHAMDRFKSWEIIANWIVIFDKLKKFHNQNSIALTLPSIIEISKTHITEESIILTNPWDSDRSISGPSPRSREKLGADFSWLIPSPGRHRFQGIDWQTQVSQHNVYNYSQSILLIFNKHVLIIILIIQAWI